MSYSFHVFFSSRHERRIGATREQIVCISIHTAGYASHTALPPRISSRLQRQSFVFGLRENTHTHTFFCEKKRQPDKHTLLLGVLLQYISSSLSFCMICLPNTCLECGGGCAARSPFQSPRMLGGKWRYYLSALAVSWGCFREIQGGNW